MSSLYATGHVHALLDDNLTFTEFALRVAGIAEPERGKYKTVPDTWRKYAEETLAEIEALEAMSLEQREIHCELQKAEEIERLRNCIERHESDEKRARETLQKVKSWTCAPEVEVVKREMERSLQTSLEGESATSYFERKIAELEGLSWKDFFDKSVGDLRARHTNHLEAYAQDVACTNKHNRMRQALWESLKTPHEPMVEVTA